EIATAMAVAAPALIHQIGRVADDEVGAALDAGKNIAAAGRGPRHAVQPGIGPAVVQRLLVDIAKNQLDLAAPAGGDGQSARPAACSDIDDAEAGFLRPGQAAQQPGETISVGTEEDGVVLHGRIRRMDEELSVER